MAFLRLRSKQGIEAPLQALNLDFPTVKKGDGKAPKFRYYIQFNNVLLLVTKEVVLDIDMILRIQLWPLVFFLVIY